MTTPAPTDWINPVASQANLIPQGTAMADILMKSPPIGGLEDRVRCTMRRAYKNAKLAILSTALGLVVGIVVTHLYPEVEPIKGIGKAARIGREALR